MNMVPDEDRSDRANALFEQNPTLTFKGGGWVLLGAGLISIALLAWAISGTFFGNRPIGDGRNIHSYQFDLSNLDVSMNILATSGNPRDFLSAYENPESILGRDILAYNQKNRRPWVVTGDRVIGVVIGDHARAYPVRCLNAHEIIHDNLGGIPIVVTYSPFADAPVVLKNDTGHTPTKFGVSGLLCDSALLMFNQTPETPSLWSPLLGRAISGPLAGTKLREVPDVNLCTWRDWLGAHPETTVILPNPASARRYKEFSYLRYFNDPSDGLEYPAAPLPVTSRFDAEVPRLKSRVIAVTAGGVRRIWPLTMLVKALGADEGTIELIQGDVPIRFEITKLPQSALVRSLDESRIKVQPRLWFAWWCCHPTTATPEVVGKLPHDARIMPRK